MFPVRVDLSPRVSIHIHPEGRMKLESIFGYNFIGCVSIHIHPEGRMKRAEKARATANTVKFQSTSTPKGG